MQTILVIESNHHQYHSLYIEKNNVIIDKTDNVTTPTVCSGKGSTFFAD